MTHQDNDIVNNGGGVTEIIISRKPIDEIRYERPNLNR
jgi:hypothetical protein